MLALLVLGRGLKGEISLFVKSSPPSPSSLLSASLPLSLPLPPLPPLSLVAVVVVVVGVVVVVVIGVLLPLKPLLLVVVPLFTLGIGVLKPVVPEL